MCIFETPRAVRGIAPSRRSACAKVAYDTQVVFDGRDAGGGAVSDQRLEIFDVTIALRTLGQHDGRVSLAIDVARREKRRRNAIDRDVMPLREVPHSPQFLARSV